MSISIQERAAEQRVIQLSETDSNILWSLSEKAVSLMSDKRAFDLSELLPAVPVELRNALADFAEGTSTSGFLLVKGVPTGQLPDTPQGYGTNALDGHATNGTLALVADALGSLIGYADEKNGDLFHDVHPVRGEEDRMENSGSVAFAFHTENAHHPLRPDALALLSLRQGHDPMTATRVASVREAVAHLTVDHVAALRQSRFRSLYPTSFTRGKTGVRPEAGPHKVIFGNPGREFIRFDSFNTSALDTEGERALRAMAEALEAVCVEVVLEPGDLLLVDNHIAAHGRSAFTPRYDGRDRWLRRCYSHRAVPTWARLMMPSERVLPATTDVEGIV